MAHVPDPTRREIRDRLVVAVFFIWVIDYVQSSFFGGSINPYVQTAFGGVMTWALSMEVGGAIRERFAGNGGEDDDDDAA